MINYGLQEQFLLMIKKKLLKLNRENLIMMMAYFLGKRANLSNQMIRKIQVKVNKMIINHHVFKDMYNFKNIQKINMKLQ